MKKNVFIFICVALFSLTILPIINLLNFHQKVKVEQTKRWSKSNLYNIDFVLPFSNQFLYSFGISTNPAEVIIGKNGWLFLGDKYEKSISVFRRDVNDEDINNAKKIKEATNLWSQFVKENGARTFQIMLAGNKETVYPELLPNWLLNSKNSVTNNLINTVDSNVYFDSRPILIEAKKNIIEPMFYRDDTHWNSIGAWIAFKSFLNKALSTENELTLLTDKDISFNKITRKTAGDLTYFLSLNKSLKDLDFETSINTPKQIEIEQYEFDTGRLIAESPNKEVAAPQFPLLIKSKNALNNKKVLWLRDSFGFSISPYMAATFSETLNMHFASVDSQTFVRLVKTFKPDYVFITVVERSSRLDWFKNYPNMITTYRPSNFIPVIKMPQTKTKDLVKISSSNKYKITGDDPSISFTANQPIKTQDATKLSFNLECDKSNNPVKVRVYWKLNETKFNNENSLFMSVNQGLTYVDMSPNSFWNKSKFLSDIRIKIESPTDCNFIKINNLELGK